jgi:hypothetical protein
MSREYNVGQVYDFAVVDIIEHNEQKFIRLSDGFRDTFRVHPFHFQVEWEPYTHPTQLKCFVKSVNVWGLPFLQQHKKSLLEELYTNIGEEYAFIIKAVKEDENTSRSYYLLKDPHGIEHRYYLSENEPVKGADEVVSFIVNGIEETNPSANKSHLIFKSIEDINTLKSISSAASPAPNPNQPVTEPVIAESDESDHYIGVENETTEFKTSIVFVPGTGRNPNIDEQLKYILKTITGFMNAKGGSLYLGVNDNGYVTGIEPDLPYLNSSTTDTNTYKSNEDHYELKIRNTVRWRLGTRANAQLKFEFKRSGHGKLFCEIRIGKSERAVLMDGNKLYQRTGNMTQLITGDDLTSYIENRFLERYKFMFDMKSVDQVHQKQSDLVTETEVPEDVIEVTPTVIEQPIHTPESQNLANRKVWYYMTFYKDGRWSFQNAAVQGGDVEKQIPIWADLKKGRLLQIYDNGCVNVTIPYDNINPKGSRGRKLRNEGHLYSNGWNTGANLMKVCLVGESDLMGIESSIDGRQYLKVHAVSDVSIHDKLHLKGNTVLSTENFNATLHNVKLIAAEDRFLISELIYKKHYRTTTTGFLRTDPKISKRVLNYEHLQDLCK